MGLNFVSEEECDSFFRIVDATIETRNRKRQEKRNRQKSQQAPNAPLPQVQREPARPPPMQGGLSSTDGVQLRNNKINSVTLTPAPAPAQSKNFLSSSFGLGNNAKDKKRKVTKADISQPTNFVHLSHVGWDAQKGFDLAGNENDEVLNEFFVKAGVSEVELKDRDTRAFIYDFIQSNNVLASVKQYSVESPTETAAPMPPPVPTRHPSVSFRLAILNMLLSLTKIESLNSEWQPKNCSSAAAGKTTTARSSRYCAGRRTSSSTT